jgi:alpha-glucoside transport system substrate-binding protein
MSARRTRIARVIAALGLLAASAGCGSTASSGSVTIMVPWSGAEFDAFYKVIEQFEATTGVNVHVEVTRAQTEQLDAAVQADHPPDLAVLPSVGAVDQYATEHELQPLHNIDSDVFTEPFRGLMSVGGTVYAVPVKADVKSLIWYDPKVSAAPPTDPKAQKKLVVDSTDYWCLGLESGPTSGWPGADWIADLFLAEQGVGPYEQWLSGSPEWTGQLVENSWNTWAGLVAGSTGGATTTAFNDAAAGMVSAPPKCRLAHGALSAMGFSTSLSPGGNYDFAVPAKPAPLEVSADFLGMFTAHNPEAEALIDYLSSTKAQTMWVQEPGGYAFSANSTVKIGAYPDEVERRIAALLQPGSGHPLCFGAADMMRTDLSTAFYQAVVNYVEIPNSTTLTKLLNGLNTTQQVTGASQIPPDEICST